MGAHDAYERLLPILLGQPKKNIHSPNSPAEETIVEGKKIGKLILNDRDVLVESGLDIEYLDSFDDRLGTYEIAEAKYIVQRDSTEGLQQRIRLLQEKVIEKRKVLLHYLSFALKDDENGKLALSRIAEGRTLNNKVYDIRPIVELAEMHIEELKVLNFNETVLEDATILYKEVFDVQAELNSHPKEVSDVKDIRNRAYTYLNEAFAMIKEHAQFVFWQDEEKLKLYKSKFRATRKHKKVNGSESELELEPLGNNSKE